MSQATIQSPSPPWEGTSESALPKVKKHRPWLPWAAGSVAFLLGIGIGASGGADRPTQAELNQARAEISELRADNSDLGAENSDLLVETKDSRTQIAQLKDTLAASEAAKGTITRLKDRVATLEGQLATAEGASGGTTAQSTASSAGGETLSGNGSKTVTITTDGGTLSWTNDGNLFQLWSDSMDVFVNSQGSSGTTEIPGGSVKLTVNAIGNWTIQLP